MKTTKEQNLKNKNSGITLIALVITIIVMLILVAVTITMAVKGGLFGYAQTAAKETNNAIADEQSLGNGRINIAGEWYDSPQEYVDTITGGNKGDKVYLGTANEATDSGIGYYVYVDGQYGVIFADMAFGVEYGQFGEYSSGAYSYAAEEHAELKKYYLKGTYDPDLEGFGEMPVLEVDKTQGGTIDRFYVMSLSDAKVGSYWNEKKKYIDGTSVTFGKGKENTEMLITYWDDDENAAWADQDIWNNLSVDSDWFVPSREEWAAFAKNLNITSSNRSDCGLGLYYWSSSQADPGKAWFITFIGTGLGTGNTDNSIFDGLRSYWVRLCTTF